MALVYIIIINYVVKIGTSKMNKEIFEGLVDIMTQQEFANSQQEFFDKNAKLFEDTEENKLEYTSIHTEYVYILDEVVEANLREKFSNDQIEAFNAGFKDHLPEYKKSIQRWLILYSVSSILRPSKKVSSYLRISWTRTTTSPREQKSAPQWLTPIWIYSTSMGCWLRISMTPS
jgi:hypothetical protein